MYIQVLGVEQSLASLKTTAAGNWLFGTAPIGVEVWLLALAGAALMWLLEEMRKAWLRRMLARTLSP